MKRLAVIVLSLAMLSGSISFASSKTTVTVNGSAVSIPDTPPFVENGRTYVPVRAVLKAFGCDQIDWQAPNVIVHKASTTIVIPVGHNSITKNGTPIQVDAPAIIRDCRTYLPIRSVIEALGGSVSWDSSSRTVIIVDKGSSPTDATQASPKVSGKLETDFIDVGQGDAILIEHGDTDILIDAGDKGYGDDVVNYLKSKNVPDLDLVIATHPHADHIGGLPEVFAAFDVKRYIDSGTAATSQIYKIVESAATAEGCPNAAGINETISYGDMTVQIIRATGTWKDPNDSSVIALVTYGKTKELFTGDASSNLDQWVSSVGHVNIYKAEHHGSYTGNNSALLSVLKPDISVISYGIGNKYGHPHQEALDILKTWSKQVLWTGGKSVVITSDGHTVSAQ